MVIEYCNKSRCTFRLLVRHKAALEAVRSGGSGRSSVGGIRPLHDATEGGHVRSVGVLLKAGADVDAPLSTGATALHIAARYVCTRCDSQ